MKKTVFTFVACLAFSASAFANVKNDTIVNINDAKNVQVISDNNNIKITIKGLEKDPNYYFSYQQKDANDNSASLLENLENWDFNILPLHKKNKEKYQNRNSTYVDLGLTAAINGPEGSKVNMANSWEIYWNVCDLISFKNKRSEVSVGFGLGWRNFRLKDGKRFYKDGNNVIIANYPDGAIIDFSRIKQFHVSFPVSYTYSFSKHANIDFSAIFNLNTYSSIKTRYSLDGEKQKDFSKKIHQTPTSVDFRLGINWRNIGVYVKYSPINVINSSFGPKFQPITTGISLGF